MKEVIDAIIGTKATNKRQVMKLLAHLKRVTQISDTRKILEHEAFKELARKNPEITNIINKGLTIS